MKHIRVCCGRHCQARSSNKIMSILENFFGLSAGEKNATIDLDYCRCLGFCSEAPNVAVDDKFVTGTGVETVLADIEKGGKKREDISAHKINFDDEFLPL